MRLRMYVKRLDAIEERIGDLPCIVCRDYPTRAEVVSDRLFASPDRICPACGRVARWLIVVPQPDELEDVA